MFWFKCTRDGETRPIAQGPYTTEDEALAAQTAWQAGPPGGSPPEDPGEVVEADENYPNTLPHGLGRVAINDVDYYVYSDGTTEPV